MQLDKSAFARQGFVLIKQALPVETLAIMNNEYDRLLGNAKAIIAQTVETGMTLSSYYREHPDDIIVVPELHQPLEPCRIEYIAHCSALLNTKVIQPIQHMIDELMGKPFVLFKDKCNVKNPGGGAFPPHQDIAAYYHFTPKFHVTAAVMLDASTIENGCVEMALDYQKYTSLASQIMHGPFGGYPFFDFYPSGPRNGDIVDEVSAVFDWQPMQAEPGDIVLFNSFVPHRSAKNTSDKRRRNFFFTYNALEEGDWYQTYYQTKQQHFDNKMFHVSTPTQHGSML